MSFLKLTGALLALATSLVHVAATPVDFASHPKNATVLILGGGVTGVIAARSLAQKGITSFIIVEARSELGGRAQDAKFGAKGKEVTVELGCNWVQGTQTGDGLANPIWGLVKKHNVKVQNNDWDNITTYDMTGANDYTDLFFESEDAYTTLTVGAGTRVDKKLVDATGRVGYALTGWKPQTPQARASEYYQFDWEYAQTPEQSSWIASSWGNNFTYDPDVGGFGGDNLMAIDQRGFKTFIQAEAATFLKPNQVMFNSTVTNITYSNSGVNVTLKDGRFLLADYAITTFSVGVLQNDDVGFSPPLPDWKEEAIQSIVMATYTKIFFQFDHDFWFDTQMGLYADEERGRYPVWQTLDHVDFLPGSGVVFVTTTGDYSIRIESLPDSQVKAEVLGVLQTMFPHVKIPEPLDFMFPRWNANPLFRGSYSNWPPSFFSQHHQNLRANVGRLWFSGEAMSLKYFGFLHGAYFEGERAGFLLAECIKGGSCVEDQVTQDVTNCAPYKI
ncbi:amine oxidase [Sistotremastrum niveocremeum HHB9708]|uniref:Amine oxidase n=1 Tax=Sistotremastrum niveocremeum HHB9708 TaxID=1314777 RepID=A0A164S9Y4_9AGAM|nr:amine oxidase [Sistotremastrum niveocremeum HHB9708]